MAKGASPLASLDKAIKLCQACELFRDATQAVPGSGPLDAAIMLVGEQPGDREDQVGLPFVGPAGRLLDDALERAGIDREQVYLTNAVKHFRWIAPADGSARRLHKKPGVRHVRACVPWLHEELEIVQPSLVVLLGATATLAVFGTDVKLTDVRGQVLDPPVSDLGTVAPQARFLATLHPSAILRSTDRAAKMALLVDDLRTARRLASA